MRDRREYHRLLRATPGYSEAQSLKLKEKMLDPAYAEIERAYERERGAVRRAAQGAQINQWARLRHAARMAEDPNYRKSKASNALRWQKGNRPKVNAYSVLREFQKVQAAPLWADKDHIQAFYDVAAAYRAMGVECEVDHIVPLRSPRVCGLHVGDNLQLLAPGSNKAKGNRYWPGMP